MGMKFPRLPAGNLIEAQAIGPGGDRIRLDRFGERFRVSVISPEGRCLQTGMFDDPEDAVYHYGLALKTDHGKDRENREEDAPLPDNGEEGDLSVIETRGFLPGMSGGWRHGLDENGEATLSLDGEIWEGEESEDDEEYWGDSSVEDDSYELVSLRSLRIDTNVVWRAFRDSRALVARALKLRDALRARKARWGKQLCSELFCLNEVRPGKGWRNEADEKDRKSGELCESCASGSWITEEGVEKEEIPV